MDNIEQKLASLEALLFLHGEPVAAKKISATLGVDIEAARTLLDDYASRLEAAERGLWLLRDGEKVQLATKPAFGKLLEAFLKEEMSEDLTPASLETLAVISYFGPISRARIEYVRGVNSLFILRSLLVRGLIERFADPKNAATYLYRPSFDLLKHLGVRSAQELPAHDRYKTLLQKFEASPDVGSHPATQ